MTRRFVTFSLAVILIVAAAGAFARPALVSPQAASLAETVTALTTPEMDGRRSGTPGGPRGAQCSPSAGGCPRGGLRACDLTWGEQKIFECENFFAVGEFSSGAEIFRDLVQSRVEAGQDMNLHNGHAILFSEHCLARGLSQRPA